MSQLLCSCGEGRLSLDTSFSLPPPVGFGPFGNNGCEDFSCALRGVKGQKGTVLVFSFKPCKWCFCQVVLQCAVQLCWLPTEQSPVATLSLMSDKHISSGGCEFPRGESHTIFCSTVRQTLQSLWWPKCLFPYLRGSQRMGRKPRAPCEPGYCYICP